MRRSIWYLRLGNVTSLDPLLPHESIDIENLVDVSALRDEALRQIASSYVAIVRERRLTARYCADEANVRPFGVTIDPNEWGRYVAHRLAQPQRFMPELKPSRFDSAMRVTIGRAAVRPTRTSAEY